MITLTYEQAKELAVNFSAVDKNDLFGEHAFAVEDMPDGEYTLTCTNPVTGNKLLEHKSGWYMPIKSNIEWASNETGN